MHMNKTCLESFFPSVEIRKNLKTLQVNSRNFTIFLEFSTCNLLWPSSMLSGDVFFSTTRQSSLLKKHVCKTSLFIFFDQTELNDIIVEMLCVSV